METTEPEYRYTDLIGEAIITLDNGFISVTLLDTEVNPNRKPLFFDLPIKSDHDANPIGNDPVTRNVNIIAGLNLAWYTYHTQKDGFRFKGENGQFAQKWEELEAPDEVTATRMDPVRPRAVADAIRGQSQPAAL